MPQLSASPVRTPRSRHTAPAAVADCGGSARKEIIMESTLTPPRALAGGLLFVHLLLRIFPDLHAVFLLVPGHTMTRPWQVLTAGYCEDALVNLIAGIGALLASDRLLSRAFGGDQEVLRFVVLTNALQACLTWVCMIFLYILFREEHFLFVSGRTPPHTRTRKATPAGLTQLLCTRTHGLARSDSPLILTCFRSASCTGSTRRRDRPPR